MTMKEMLLALVKESVEKCYSCDRTLIVRTMEQATVARFYYYAQKAIEFDSRFIDLRNFNLDSEYYKNGLNLKKTESHQHGTRPDVILHKRESNSDNLIIAEFKTMGRNQNNEFLNDFKKLKDFTKDPQYYYFLGVFIELKVDRPSFTYFQDGHIKSEIELSSDRI